MTVMKDANKKGAFYMEKDSCSDGLSRYEYHELELRYP
jgi:hypothetical protein